MSIQVLSVRGLRPECGKVDRDLWLWFCEAKKDSENYHGPRVTKRLVQAKAKQAFQAAGILNFKASDGWYIRWLKRWHRIGVDNAKKLANQDNTSETNGSNSNAAKRRSTKSRTKGPHMSKKEASNVNLSTKMTCSSTVNVSGCKSAFETTASDYFVEVGSPNVVSKAVEVPLQFYRNNQAQNMISASVDTSKEIQIVDGTVNKNFVDSFFSKNYNLNSTMINFEPAEMNDSFTTHSLSLLNLDEIAWNGTSCFPGPEPQDGQLHEMRNLETIYLTETETVGTSPNGREDLAMVEEKLLKMPKLMKPIEGSLNLLKDCNSEFLCFASNLKNSSFATDISLQGTVDLTSKKTMTDCTNNVDVMNVVHMKDPSNSAEQVINVELKNQCAAEKDAEHMSNHVLKGNTANVYSSCKSRKLESIGNDMKMRNCNIPSNKIITSEVVSKNTALTGNLVLQGSAGVVNSENFPDLMHEQSVSDCAESVCENFAGDIMVQHDLEDVSVSSDFVNQLYNEHSFELNLDCGNEPLAHPIKRKVRFDSEPKYSTINVGNDCYVGQSLKNTSSESTLRGKSSLHATNQMSGNHSEADDDFSGDENDYISKAVLLSMQEDDFSILNCDQSPFQGTISVIDENSQSESEKLTDLEGDRGCMELSSPSSVMSAIGNSEVVFPLSCDSERNVVCESGGVFSNLKCEEKGLISGELIEGNRSQNILQTLSSLDQDYGNDHSVLFQTPLVKSSEEPPKCLISSHSLGNKILNEHRCGVFTTLSVGDNLTSGSSNIFVTSLCSDGEIMPHAQDVLQVSPSLDGASMVETRGAFEISCPKEGQEVLSMSSSGDKSGLVQGQDVFQISSCMDGITFVGAQDVFQISSPNDSNAQDVFITACSSDKDVSISQSLLSDSSNSKEKTLKHSSNMLTFGECSSQEAEDTSSMYIVPCSSDEQVGPKTTGHFAVSNFFLGNCLPVVNNLDLGSINTHIGSLPDVTIVNADSTTLPQMQSRYELDNDGISTYITLSSLDKDVVKTVSLPPPPPPSIPRVCDKKLESALSSPAPPTSLVAKSHTSHQVGSSLRTSNSESTKENGYISQNVPTAETVLSAKGKDSLGSPPKLLRKNAICLTEKGTNTAKGDAAALKNKAAYRRSSGDRYFPYFKERVADYAIKHTAKEAARTFGVNVDSVTMWTRGRYEIDSVTNNYPDQIMLRWLKRSRESGVILTREQVVEKALQLLKTPGSWVKDKSRWFHVWASRLADEKDKTTRAKCDDKGVSSLPLDCGEKKALYPDEFKVEVVLYAEQTSKNLASSIFNIARKRVFEWSASLKVSKHTQEEQLTAISSSNNSLLNKADMSNILGHHLPSGLPTSLLNNGTRKLKLNGKGVGRAVTNVAVDRELWVWFCEQTAKKSKPKSRDIRAKAVELFRAHNHDKIQCSHGWLKKWSLRYGIALRHEGDGDLLAWCLEQFDRNKNISHRDLLNHAHESLTGTHKSEFKASAGWLVRFCKRHRNLLSAKPTIDVEIPTVLKHRVSEFRRQVQQLIQSSRIPIERVGSMDEVPLNFTAAGSGGSRSRLLLRRSGLENCHATVVLSCLANGELLPPAVIFKGEGPTEEIVFDGVPLLILYQQDCCMSSSIMLEWLDNVWIKNVPSQSVLVVDCYDPHCDEAVHTACGTAHTSLSVIPAGCSFKLQPLDLAISRQFEANIYNRWTRHFSDVDQLSTCKRTSYSSNTDIARWVAEAFSNLKITRKEAIRRSFVVTGLTTALDGSEDHFLEDPTHIPFLSLFTS